MKRKNIYVMMLLPLFMVFLVGCDFENTGKDTETIETENATDYGSEENSESTQEDNTYPEHISYLDEIRFEENVTSHAENIVEAKCIKVYEEGRYVYTDFEVIEILKGESVGELVTIKNDKYYRAYYYLPSRTYVKKDYIVGQTYLLLMRKASSVYDEFDYFYEVADIFISKENMQETEMYGLPLSESSTAEGEFFTDYETLKAYTKDLIAQNPSEPDEGWGYIRSDKPEDIVAQTPVIVKAKVIEHYVVGMESDRESCYCIVTETLKGEEIADKIRIVVPLETIITGEEYIFMLKPVGNLYAISSRHSIYPVTDTEKVQEIEALIEQMK